MMEKLQILSSAGENDTGSGNKEMLFKCCATPLRRVEHQIGDASDVISPPISLVTP